MVDSTATRVPDVSIVVPAHNAMPYLLRSLQSVVDQTIGADRIEAIVVDDGSTDGTGEELDRWAEQHPGLFRVVHQAASGGPAGPRNVALELARGRYVFFLDADDYLGAEALERLVRTADENHSDIVLGRMTNDGNRGVPQSMFRRSAANADLFSSRVYWTVSVLKLYRRSLIEDHGLRFPTQFPTTSDQPFAGLAYLRARTISVNADYDYYYVVRRNDRGHVTQSGNAVNRLDVYEWMCNMLAREVPDLRRREYLLTRHFQVDLRRIVLAVGRPLDPEIQQNLFTRLGALVRTHLTPGVASRLAPGLLKAYQLAGENRLDEMVAASRRLAAARSITGWQLTWEGDELVVACRLRTDPAEPLTVVLADGPHERFVPAAWVAGRIRARVPVRELTSGTWRLRLRIGAAPDHLGMRIKGPAEPSEVRWHGPMAARARLCSTEAHGAVLEVSSSSPRDTLGRSLRSLKRRIRS